LKARVLHVDEYRARITSRASRDTFPGLYEKVELGEAVLDLPTASQLELKLRMARDVCHSLEDQIRDQLDRDTTLVVEGDDVLPELAGRFTSSRLRALFILPRSEREVAQFEAIRDPVLALADPDRGQSRTRTTWSYAEWLRREAIRLGLSVVDAAATAALITRAERVLGLDRR
jgi:hypothetical protein